MTKYIITGSFEGLVEVTYSETEMLQAIDFEQAKLTEEQLRYLMTMPLYADRLQGYCDRSKLTVVEKNVELTFEMFYNRYGNKVGKHKAETAWNRLSAADRLKAWQYISRYKAHLKNNAGLAMLYPATYINQKRWED